MKLKLIALVLTSLLLSQAGYAKDDAASVAFAQKLALSMKSWLQQEMKSNGGKLLVTDPVDGEKLALSIVQLDAGDHLHAMSKTRFLSWGEFKDTSGKAVMLDMYFKLEGDKLVFDNEMSIYSKAGKKRYAWDESGEFLKKLPVPKPAK